METLKKLETEYEDSNILLNSLNFSLYSYEEKAAKYFNDPTLPDYYKKIYLPTKNKMENQKDKILSRRQELRKLIKTKQKEKTS